MLSIFYCRHQETTKMVQGTTETRLKMGLNRGCFPARDIKTSLASSSIDPPTIKKQRVE